MTSPSRTLTRLRSFRFAIAGLATLVKTQPNARIHGLITLNVLAAAVIFRLGSSEWCWIILAITAVWSAEAINTSIEFLADALCPDFHPLIKQAKDIAAGAVLITASGAIAIGFLVFGPKVMALMA